MKKRFFGLGVILGLGALPLALACFDPDAVLEKNPQKALAAFAKGPGFEKCLSELEKKGVDRRDKDVRVWRKSRPKGDTGPILYWVRVEGKDGNDRLWHIKMGYDLNKHKFECKGGASDSVPRDIGGGSCF